jgi:arsenate reductase (glutaredoxin)
LTASGVAFESVHYLDEPLSASELKNLLRSAHMKPLDVLRKNEPAYREYVSGKDLGEAQLIELMVKHPELIQRPIVVRGEKAVLARPVARLISPNVDRSDTRGPGTALDHLGLENDLDVFRLPILGSER